MNALFGLWIASRRVIPGILADAQPWSLAQIDESMPIIVSVTVVAGVALAVGVAWLLHVYTVSAGRKDLAAYKDQVVALSDKIDALKQRHKILPFIDKDFTDADDGRNARHLQ